MYFAAGGVGGEVGLRVGCEETGRSRAGPELLLCCRKLFRGARSSLLLYTNLHSAYVGVRASVWLARLCVFATYTEPMYQSPQPTAVRTSMGQYKSIHCSFVNQGMNIKQLETFTSRSCG